MMPAAVRRPLLLALLLAMPACGVSTYRTERPSSRIEMRLVVPEGAEGPTFRRWSGDGELVLESRVIVSTERITEVQLHDRPDGARHIVLALDAEGRTRLADITERYRGRRLAVLVGRRVVVAPTIRNTIAEGVAHITVGDADIEAVYDAMTR